MKYYCESIPVTLAEKLKEKGMPMTLWQNGNNTDYVEVIETRQEIFDESQIYEIGVRYNPPTYGEVFDWFLNKEVFVNAYPERIAAAYGEYIYMYRPFVNGWIGKESDRTSWHEAANAAIEKAITLI